MDERVIQQWLRKLAKPTKYRRFRTWERTSKWDIRDIEKSFTFKILSYNVLAQNILESQLVLFQNCFPRNLEWEIRSKHLFDEIIQFDPDILCLQEVQASHLASFYSKFEEIGYTSVYKKRTGHRDDGCAIYFKNSVFRMEDHILVEFRQASHGILSQNEVGLAVRLVPLDSRAPASPLVVATTRLFRSFNDDHVRLAQLHLFLAHLERFANNGCQLGYHPIILSGDMNAHHESFIIKFLTRGHVSICKTAIRGSEIQNVFNNQPPEMEGPENPWDDSLPFVSELEHPLKFHSVYAFQKKNGDREVTTFFRSIWKNYDYMFFSRDSRLRLLGRYRLPSESSCRAIYGPHPVPTLTMPSNHFPLAAIFEFRAPMANEIGVQKRIFSV